MFQAIVNNGSYFKDLIEAMKDVFIDVNFQCTETDITFQAVDSSRAVRCSVELQAGSFHTYKCDESIILGMNIGILSKILKCAGNDEMIIMQAEDDLKINFCFEKPGQERISKFKMDLVDIDSEYYGHPERLYDATVTMPAKEFSMICHDLSQFGDTVTIACTKKGIEFSCNDKGGITLRESSSVSIDLSAEAVTQTKAIKSLIMVAKVHATIS